MSTPEDRKLIAHSITGSVCVIGVLGHSLALYVLAKKKKQTYNTVLLISLSVTDILILLYNISQKLVMHQCLLLDYCHCYIELRKLFLWVVWTYLTMCLIWIIVMATFGRFIYVCYPVEAGAKWFKAKYGLRAVLGVMVGSLIVLMPVVTIVGMGERAAWRKYNTDVASKDEVVTTSANISQIDIVATVWPHHPDDITLGDRNVTSRDAYNQTGDDVIPPAALYRCHNTATNDSNYLQKIQRLEHSMNFVMEHPMYHYYVVIFLLGIMMYALPMIILCVLNAKLILELKRAHASHQAMTSVAERERHGATVNMVAIVVTFLVIHSPYFIQCLGTSVGEWSQDFWIFYHSLPAYNSAVDFVLYFLFYKTLRNEAKGVLRSWFRCIKKSSRQKKKNLRRDLSTTWSCSSPASESTTV